MDDPWYWNLERVIQELCSVNRSWDPPSLPLKFPVPGELEPLLREQEVDGHTLLTYDHAELCEGLGIRLLKHKATFKYAIDIFRSRSQKYRLHQKRTLSNFEDEPNQSPVIEPTGTASYLSSAPQPSVPEKPGGKKRRVAPMLVSTGIDANGARNIPTEADTIMTSVSEDDNHDDSRNPDTDDLTPAYLGQDAVSRFDLIDNYQPSEEVDPYQGFQIGPSETSRIPKGRRQQVHRVFKGRMVRNGLPPQLIAIKPDMVPGANNPDNDEVLPLYGESEDEYDSETWEQVEAEQKETGHQPGLADELVEDVIDKYIESCVSHWKEHKLPMLAYKQSRIWAASRLGGRQKLSSDENRKEIRGHESRIAKFRRQILAQRWFSLPELEEIFPILKTSIEDRELCLWRDGVINSDVQPEKCWSPPRKSVRRPRQPRSIPADEEEILTSEDELDYFIDDDSPIREGSSAGSPMRGIDDNLDYQNEASKDFEQLGAINPTREEGDAGINRVQTPPISQLPSVIDLVTPDHSAQGSDSSSRPSRSGTPRGRDPSKAHTGSKATQHDSALIMDIDDLEPTEILIATELGKIDAGYLSYIFTIASKQQSGEVWMRIISNALENGGIPKSPYDTNETKTVFAAVTLLRLFEMYRDNVYCSIVRYKNLPGKKIIEKMEDIKESTDMLTRYTDFLRRLSDRFHWDKSDAQIHDEEILPRKSPDIKQPSVAMPPPVKKRRKRKYVRSREAESLREDDRARAAELAHRRTMLRAKMQQLRESGNVDFGTQGNMIINEGKDEDQGFVYVHSEIQPRIKDHQLGGVRFMWDHIVGSKGKQGCLLAHTMGLGKTMQVITLLVAIAQAATSEDPTISSQIPEDLKQPKILILCPPSLLDNWMDELLLWAPEGHGLGDFFKVDQSSPVPQRETDILAWDERGGVLLIGYALFKKFVLEDEEFCEILCQGPNLVVADEAHEIKNPSSKVHVATAHFRTRSRIALTGSPLANNVEEYHSMVNWIHPGYLSDLPEFRAEYAIPIDAGLRPESTISQRREALKRLKVLKEEVSPKVQRVTTAVLKQDVPTKQEFIISVPLTSVQREAYEAFILYHNRSKEGAPSLGSVATLGLLCAHPSIFMRKLQEQKSGSISTSKKMETLPDELISQEIALLHKKGDLDAYSLSWKILILLSILDECKRVGDPVLIFSQSIFVLDYLEHLLRMKKFSVVRLDGSTPTDMRLSQVKEFNKGQIDLFLISTKAGGVGFNMTGANRVIIFDLKFNPQQEQQAVGRAYRIGQKKPVFVYRLICGGTCEEKTLSVAIWKMQLASRVVDKKNPIHNVQSFGQTIPMPTEPVQEDIDQHIGKDVVIDSVIKAHRSGIRAITMMDTFEEEELEDAGLTPEDHQEAQRLIAENEARRQAKGAFIPIHRAREALSRLSVEDDTMTREGQEPPRPSPPVRNGAENYQVPHLPPKTNYSTIQPPTNNGTTYNSLPPIQGATTHLRTAPQSMEDCIPADPDPWPSRTVFEKDLMGKLSAVGNVSNQHQREAVARSITEAVWSTQHLPEKQIDLKREIICATASLRFVEIVCSSALSPTQLASMEPTEINLMRQRDWAGPVEKITRPHQNTSAGRRPRALPEVENAGFGRNKPLRLDDQRALEAVIENRKAKQSSHDKGPRLPSWALDAVTRQGRVTGSPVPISDESSTSSSNLLHKTPFK